MKIWTSKRNFFFLIILFCISSNFLAQDSVLNPDNILRKPINIIKVNDSLLDKTYVELNSLIQKNKSNSVLSKLYTDSYLKKAKKEKNLLEIAEGYSHIAKISNDKLVIRYLDSSITITKKIKNERFPGIGYIRKGVYYFSRENYNKALKNYLIGLQYAKDNNNVRQLIAIKHNIGLLKNALGSKEEAQKAFKENLTFIKTQDTINKYLDSYIITLFAISDTYHRMDLPDSATYYVDKGLSKSFRHQNKYMYTRFLLLNSVNNYELGFYKKALDTLFKVEKDSELDEANKVYCNLQIAKVLIKTNNQKKAIKYLKKIDSIVKPENYTPEKRRAFELLIDYYKKNKDIDRQLKTMTKLITMDSLFNSNNSNIKSDIVKNYDTTLLIDERNVIIHKLNQEKERSRIVVYIFIGIIFILIFLVGNYYRTQRLYKHRFSKLLQNQNRPKTEQTNQLNEEKTTSGLDIQEDVILDILDKLTIFEQRQDFLNPTIKMGTVAKKLKTNSSYLSKIINIHKGKNFVNYVNDLRVDYCIEKLKFDKKFRLYSIKSISEEVGFNSVQSFSRAFYKKTGVYPSFFIKNISNQSFTKNN
ncbi:AraC family transcriptional regulator [uncultured Aquimarina sp.]|uniref:helix-turn-helix domain-containing protein n=1 Tax=uncultured Aquimarina sp. TaxID=575652 RepID=UPI00260D9345|nr:AraC family transcriptional regulator [uncultured Aquimarina sp.]